MSRNHKILAAALLLPLCALLIAWSLLRDSDAASREPRDSDKTVTVEQVSPAVQEVIRRLSAGGVVHEIQEDRRGTEVKYEVEIIRGNVKTEYDLASDGSIIKQKSKPVK